MSFWIQLSAGRGPIECSWALGLIAPHFEAALRLGGIDGYRCIDRVEDLEPNSFKSILWEVEDDEGRRIAESWRGSILLQAASPFRLQCKRKNWFVGLSLFDLPERTKWNLKDIRIEPFIGSGKGGQHRNKNETAIRAAHLPSGLYSIANEERSRKMNEQLALMRLDRKLVAMNDRIESLFGRKVWTQHNALERGNPVVRFQFASGKLIRRS